MKRFLSLTLCLMLCLSTLCCVTTYAAGDVLNVSKTFNTITGELKVSGTVTNAKGNIPMTLMVVASNGSVFDFAETSSSVVAGGKSTFAFDAIVFSNSAKTDTYKVVVSCDFIYASKSIDFKFSGVDVKRDTVEELGLAYDDSSVAKAVAILDKNYTLFGFGEEYTTYTKDQKDVVGKMLLKMDYTAPDDQDPLTNDEIKSVVDQINAAATLAAEGKAIAEVIDCDDLKAWVKDFGVNYGFTTDDDKTEYDEKVLSDYFNEAIEYGDFKTVISKCYVGANSFSKLAENLYEKAILHLSANANYYKTRDIIENKSIEAFIPIDRSDFAKLSTSKRTALYQEICKSSYSTMEAFVEAIDDMVDELNVTSSSSGGSSGGSSSGSKFTRPGVVNVDPEEAITTVFPFTDLVGLDWATESIQQLYFNGIIKGKTETDFDPNGNVTRAEFAKMIVGALDLDLDEYANTFSDVDADAWYATYIQTAYNNGIVKGSNGIFNPNGKITREDIAVMIYRALEYSPVTKFSGIIYDKEQISSYAVESVLKLYDTGIMSGDGTGYIYPQSNATRAEAAKLVYFSFVK